MKRREIAVMEAEKNNKSKMSKGAFWMAYCGMQKAIRLGALEQARKLCYAAWIENQWMTYRRLITILFEDVGVANKPLIYEMASFYKDGKSFKNESDVLGIVDKITLSPKSRDADDLFVVAHRDGCDEFAKLNEVMYSRIIKSSDDLNVIYNNFSENGIEFDKDIIPSVLDLSKNLGEYQFRSIPILSKMYDNTEVKTFKDFNDMPSHSLFYNNLMPYTVLDMHGFHGKTTLATLCKKMREGQIELLEKYGISSYSDEQLLEFIGCVIFAFEGCSCKNELRLTNSWKIRWGLCFREYNVQKKIVEIRNDFKEMFDRIVGLRKWFFEKRFNGSIEEIMKISEGIK